MNIGQRYNHDPRHFRFPRQMDSGGPIIDGDSRSRLADKIVFWGAVAIALLVTVLA